MRVCVDKFVAKRMVSFCLHLHRGGGISASALAKPNLRHALVLARSHARRRTYWTLDTILDGLRNLLGL